MKAFTSYMSADSSMFFLRHYIGGKDKGLMIDEEETKGIGNVFQY